MPVGPAIIVQRDLRWKSVSANSVPVEAVCCLPSREDVRIPDYEMQGREIADTDPASSLLRSEVTVEFPAVGDRYGTPLVTTMQCSGSMQTSLRWP